MLVLEYLARNWWAVVVRGAIAIVFGLVALFYPSPTLAALIILFGIWAIANGVFALVHSIGAAEAREPWWPLVFEGLLGIAAGLVTFKWPGITALTLLFVIAFWAIFTGILEISAAVRLRNVIHGEWALILGGIASVIFGALLVISPISGVLAVVWLVGIYALVFGIMLVALGLRLRGLAGQLPAPAR